MEIQRLAAFTNGGRGGNPAGVVLCDALSEIDVMWSLAGEIDHSEMAFAASTPDGHRVRYFAPAAEIPFCGDSTKASAVLNRKSRNHRVTYRPSPMYVDNERLGDNRERRQVSGGKSLLIAME